MLHALSMDAQSFKGSVIVIRYEGPKAWILSGCTAPLKSG